MADRAPVSNSSDLWTPSEGDWLLEELNNKKKFCKGKESNNVSTVASRNH